MNLRVTTLAVPLVADHVRMCVETQHRKAVFDLYDLKSVPPNLVFLEYVKRQVIACSILWKELPSSTAARPLYA
jgi:hypothetical protein